MKIFVLMTCLLAISYASDLAIIKKLFVSYCVCIRELNAPEGWTPEVVKCALGKFDALDEQGFIIKDAVFKALDSLISNKNKLHKARQIISTCLEQEQDSKKSINETTMAAYKCVSQVIPLFDAFP